MKKIIILVLLLSIILTGCFKRKPEKASIDNKYIEYISQYTTGVISKRSTIVINLAKEIDLTNTKISVNKRLPDGILTFSPGIAGKAVWDNARTIIFYPDNYLKSDETFKGKLDLSKLFDVPKDLKLFQFEIKVLKMDFEVKVDETVISAENEGSLQDIYGNIVTSDFAENENVEKILSIKGAPNKDFKILWEHDQQNNTHKFQIKGIARDKKRYDLKIVYDGKHINVSKKDDLSVEVFGLEDFAYIGYKIVKDEDSSVSIQFSMPLDKKQNLNDFIKVNGDKSPKFLQENNIIRYYPSNERGNTVNILINKNLKSSLGGTLDKDIEISITLQQEKPKIRWVYKKGGILTGTDNFVIPFEAITLKAVDVTVVEIFEKNMIQFLQVNKNISGKNEIRRVGRPVLQKTIMLDGTGVKNLNEWNRYNLDLSKFFKVGPGSVYQVKINFRRSQSIYNAGVENKDEITNDELLKEDYDSPDGGYYYYYDDYYDNDYNDNWGDRDNPESDAYYGTRRQLQANFLASNLGIIAKGSDNGELKVVVTDMLTTKPLGTAEVEVFNYQTQSLASGKTDSDGIVSFKLKDAPFAVSVKKDNEKGYLRVDDGSSLSTTNFDVGGSSSRKGVKGFIYGERGVWRPGDTVYLYYMMEDKGNVIPQDHPVVMELYTPQGKLDKRVVKKDHVGRIYDFTFTTGESSETGDWNVLIKTGGEVFSKTIKIETVKPNRLKVDLDFGVDVITALDTQLNAKVDVKWLHGAPGRNMKYEYEIHLLPMQTTFKKYFGYVFDDPSKKFEFSPFTLPSGRTDENGLATMPVVLSKENTAPGALKAVFVGKVFEEGGDFSVDRLAIPYYPYEYFAGIKMPPPDPRMGMHVTDTDYKLDIASVDAKGNPQSGRNLEVKVYKIGWRWWWDYSQDDFNSYMSSSETRVVSSGSVISKNGKAGYNLKIKTPEWGRFLVKVTDVDSGHSCAQVIYVDWPWWVNGQRSELSGASMLSLFTDKEDYKVGDDVKVTIPVSSKGRAFISIESGSKVVDSFWVETTEGKTEFTFKATSDMAPNVYVNTTLLQPHGQVKNDLPIRLYGIVPITVFDPHTKLEPQVIVPETLSPEKEANITISEKNGREMSFTVMVVDEGLLDLTNFKTPDPWSSFYTKDALGVKSWDIYDDVVGALSNMFGPLVSVGGDDVLQSPKAQKANRFKPVVKCFGPYLLQKGEKKNISFVMPQYVGSVKTMVVASSEGAYGFADKTSFVKNPLMVLATVPRVLGPEESISLPVNVFALEDSIKNVTVKVKTEGGVIVDGEAVRSISFDKSQDKFVYFNLKTINKAGIGKIFVEATSGGEKANYDVEIDVRLSNPEETVAKGALLEPGKNFSQKIETFGIDGTNKVTMELSKMPSLNLTKRLNYLIQYPHGCIEQTVSGVFPQLYLDALTDLTPEQKLDIQNNISAGIDRIKSFATSSGGFGYWPGDTRISEWGTNYAGNFLIEARDKGYDVPSGLLGEWAQCQTKLANDWVAKSYYDVDMIQSYRLYTLALYGKPAVGAMNRMRELKDLDFRVRYRLACAYLLIGKENIAKELISNTTINIPEYRFNSYTYGSDLRDKAMILEALALMDDKATGYNLLKDIAERLGSDYWGSTQTVAYSLMAVAKYVNKNSENAETNVTYEYGTEKSSVTGNKSYILKKLKPTDGIINIENKGKGALFLKISVSGVPARSSEKSGENVLSMNVSYYDEHKKPVDVANLKQGTSFFSEVTIKNNGNLGKIDEIALSQIFPSGWEINNARINDDQIADKNSNKIDYQDIRDDRVYSYFDLLPGDSVKIKIKLTAAYSGKFYLPGINCQAMYDEKIFARQSGREVIVEK